uniref:Peptidase S9 prolyl oligopeptidase catalytic domain-containing protein n=1 Tax=viral metagenome TaxID=1070528 RepID=A0A6C0K098_9ZZZZ
MDPTDVGFLKWIDPYEKQEKHLAKTIKKENALFLSQLDGMDDLTALIKKNEIYDTESSPNIILNYPLTNPKINISLKHLNGEWGLAWKWHGADDWKWVDNLDISRDGETVAFIESAKTNYKVTVKTKSHTWTHKHLIGPDIAIIGSRLYFIEADSPLQYNRLVSVDIHSGKEAKVLYEESNKETQIEFVWCEGRALFLLSYRAGYNRLHYIRDNSTKELDPQGVAFFPVGHLGTKPVYFVREGSFTAPWKLVGCNWKLNSRISADGIEFCSLSAKILITKFYGVRTIWKMSSGEPVPIYRGVFEIAECMKLMRWFLEPVNYIWCIRPGSVMFKIDTESASIELPAIRYGSVSETGISISADGLPVRWTLIRPVGKPIGLVCTAYGGYGIATSLNTTRWRPWIDAGWAVSFLFVRGGGDGNEVWADLGRLDGKQGALDDVEACIKDLQKETKVLPHATVLFGRSAGGLIVGNMAARWPLGELFGIIYTEVPYVDLLKTAANVRLPLTEYEFEEFGNPRAGLAEFEAALAISPIHQLGPQGAPGIKVLCRSGIHDIQVYPYESVKWINALRGDRKDETKILYIDNEGHHTLKIYREYAIDFLIITKWIKASAFASTGKIFVTSK